jgi:hypothetical protein
VCGSFSMIVFGLNEARNYEIDYLPNRSITIYSNWSQKFSLAEFELTKR